MIIRIKGKLVEKKEQALVIDVQGLFYEVIVPSSVLQRIDETKDDNDNVHLIVYHYHQVEPSRSFPVLIGFMNEVERDFFQEFIKVSGIGPRAAVKAFNKPISEITRAIDAGDVNFLTTLKGIGRQRAKEIVAKLQGKVGKFGLIQDHKMPEAVERTIATWKDEALSVLMQLQYKKQEALAMIEKAVAQDDSIKSAEDLLNEIYKQKVNS